VNEVTIRPGHVEDLPDLATRRQVSEATQVAVGTLARWAQTNVSNAGPPFIRVGGSVRYRREDVLAWIEGARGGDAA